MFSYEICEIFKNTHSEKHLRKTASTCFTENTIINNGGKSELDETSTECKVIIFLNVTTLFDKMQAILFLCKLKLKEISLTFQLVFLLNF